MVRPALGCWWRGGLHSGCWGNRCGRDSGEFRVLADSLRGLRRLGTVAPCPAAFCVGGDSADCGVCVDLNTDGQPRWVAPTVAQPGGSIQTGNLRWVAPTVGRGRVFEPCFHDVLFLLDAPWFAQHRRHFDINDRVTHGQLGMNGLCTLAASWLSNSARAQVRSCDWVVEGYWIALVAL